MSEADHSFPMMLPIKGFEHRTRLFVCRKMFGIILCVVAASSNYLSVFTLTNVSH